MAAGLVPVSLKTFCLSFERLFSSERGCKGKEEALSFEGHRNKSHSWESLR